MDNSCTWHDYMQISKELDQVYHQVAVDLGISDSVHCLLYTLWELGDGLTPSQLYAEWSLNKQTGHSAIMWLERRGLVRLVPGQEDRRQKTVCLTAKGQEYARQVIVPFIKAEQAAFDALTDEEKLTLTALSKKSLYKLKEELAELNFSAMKTLL